MCTRIPKVTVRVGASCVGTGPTRVCVRWMRGVRARRKWYRRLVLGDMFEYNLKYTIGKEKYAAYYLNSFTELSF